MSITASELVARARAGLPLTLPSGKTLGFSRQPAAGKASARNKFYFKPDEDHGTEDWIKAQKRIAAAVNQDRPPGNIAAPPIRKPARIREVAARLDYQHSHKLVYRPVFAEDDVLQEEPLDWQFIGFRFDVRDGEWWFYSERKPWCCALCKLPADRDLLCKTNECEAGPRFRKAKTRAIRITLEHWTRHLRGAAPTYRSLTPVLEGGVTPIPAPWQEESYGDTAELARRLAHCLPLVLHLLEMRAYAEIELAAKRGGW